MNIHICTDYSLIPPYAVMILLSFAAGLSLQHFLNIRRGVRPMVAGFITLLAPLMSILSALLLTYVSTGGKKFGLSSMGGLFGMYASVFTLSLITRDRKSTKLALENCTLVLPLIYSISKIGCFFAGCCHGIPYHGPFCVEYSGKIHETGCIFPVQLAETVVFFLIFTAGMIMLKMKCKNTAIHILTACAAAKAMLDFLRESHIGKAVSLNQVLCLLTIAAGIVYTVSAGKARRSRQAAELLPYSVK